MNWPNVAIDEIFEVARGGSPRPIQKFLTDDPEGINWVMISDASLSNKYITKTKQRIIPEGRKNSRDVKPGDFLLTNSMSFGRPYIMRTTGCIHDGWLLLRPRNENVDQDFFYHLLGSSEIYARFAARAPGSTVKNLNSDIVRETLVPLPPLEEQKRIAAILDQADALRRLRQRAIDRLNTLGQTIFYEMFGDPLAPKGDIDVKQVGDVVSRLTNGYVGPTRDIYRENGIPYLLAKHVKNQAVTFDGQTFVDEDFNKKHSKSMLRAGDVLLVQSGHIGSSAVVPYKHDGHNCHAMIVITPCAEYLTGDYLSGALSTDAMQAAFRSIQTGQTLPHLNCKDVKKLPIAIPGLRLQEEFSRRLSAVRSERMRLEEAKKRSECLFSSLQHCAFRGEL